MSVSALTALHPKLKVILGTRRGLSSDNQNYVLLSYTVNSLLLCCFTLHNSTQEGHSFYILQIPYKVLPPPPPPPPTHTPHTPPPHTHITAYIPLTPFLCCKGEYGPSIRREEGREGRGEERGRGERRKGGEGKRGEKEGRRGEEGREGREERGRGERRKGGEGKRGEKEGRRRGEEGREGREERGRGERRKGGEGLERGGRREDNSV